jgi:hypothetical protein
VGAAVVVGEAVEALVVATLAVANVAVVVAK